MKEVEYLDGFQYTGGELNFFPHAGGYVNVTLGTTGNRIFNYVYNYTDHLGNIRLSYTKDPETGDLRILEENHYYPFGLKHGAYADYKNKIEAINNETEKAVNPENPTDINSIYARYDYKYNYRELQDEFSLNLYAMV